MIIVLMLTYLAFVPSSDEADSVLAASVPVFSVIPAVVNPNTVTALAT